MIIDTVCTYCGVGCDISFKLDNGQIIKAFAKKEGTVSQGKLCIKGRKGWEYIYSPYRIKKARIKKSFIYRNEIQFPENIKQKLSSLTDFDENFYEVDYETAYDIVAWKLKQIKDRYSPYAIAGIGGARTSCESSYFFQKFIRKYIGSPHIDNCARVCHSPSLKGMRTTIGEGAATNPFDDVYKTDFIIVIGSNTTEAHPIVANRILDVIRSGVELAVIDVREIPLSKFAKYHLTIPFESNLLVLNMMARVIIEEGLYDVDFIKRRVKGFEDFKEKILSDPYSDPELFKSIPGYEDLTEKIRAVARNYATRKSMIFWGLGITEHIDGSYSVMAITHLALLTGNVGKEGAGLMPLRGQNNVQGTCDMGCLPYFDPDYRKPAEIGLMTPDIIDAILEGKIKAIYNIGEDIAHIHPNQNKIHKALKKLEFLVVNEIFPNEITEYADIIFGVKSAYEKEGVYVNAERRLHLSQPVVKSDLPDDWEVLNEITKRMGIKTDYKSNEDVWNEVRIEAPERFSGATYQKLKENRLRGLQWPVKEKDTPVLHVGKFRTEDGYGRFHYKQWEKRGMVGELFDRKEFDDFYLTTGRNLIHYNNAAQTKECVSLISKIHTDTVFFSEEDRERLGFPEKVILKSDYGETDVLPAKFVKWLKKGTAYTTFHFAKSRINFLFGDESDIFVKTARFKSVKVKVIPVH
ncbi:formate dehydrogenase major subunit [Persephonella hydrogeniphila]|uniref:Formate dehydrogenase major subunit n=1 Tax=Persephonella hydrogeniphila TaxID=198703 RepID=A0A285N418_9AQUI|nr:molybdopterin-dependent oxidoreductase [Persephonella hydrogeniphila]SNZ04068.1 formate dehydrogenase major subunit [Persephonella hydrogeniphila]